MTGLYLAVKLHLFPWKDNNKEMLSVVAMNLVIPRCLGDLGHFSVEFL